MTNRHSSASPLAPLDSPFSPRSGIPPAPCPPPAIVYDGSGLPLPASRHATAFRPTARVAVHRPPLGHRRYVPHGAGGPRHSGHLAEHTTDVDHRQDRTLLIERARGRRAHRPRQGTGTPRLRGRPSRARRPAFRRAAAHARIGARKHGEPAGPLAAADRLRSRARSGSAMAVHEHEVAGPQRASRHGRAVRVRGAPRSAQTCETSLGHPGRRRGHRRHRAVVREGHSDARDQPVHGPTISQLPQLAPGVVCRDRRLRGAALRRLRARDGGQHGHRAKLWPRDRGRGPFSDSELDRQDNA